MPTRTKAEWEAKQREREAEKEADNDSRAELQAQLDAEVARAKEMKGAKFKKERQAVYAAIGRLKAMLAGQEVRSDTARKTTVEKEDDGGASRWDDESRSTWNSTVWDDDKGWEDKGWEDKGWEDKASTQPQEWQKWASTSEIESRHSVTVPTLIIVRGLLPTNTDAFALRDVFLKHGKVDGVKIPLMKNGKSRGFGFIEFVELAAAQKAVQVLDGTSGGQPGRNLSVKIVPIREVDSNQSAVVAVGKKRRREGNDAKGGEEVANVECVNAGGTDQDPIRPDDSASDSSCSSRGDSSE